MFESGIPLKNLIDTGSGNYWNTSRNHPWTYAEYIVLDRSSTQDNIEIQLIICGHNGKLK